MGGHAASMRVRSPSYMLGKVLNSISNQTTAFGVGQSVPTTRTPNCQSVFFHSQHQRCLCSTDLDRGVGGFIAQLNRNRSFQRSEERRVGKEGRSRWARAQHKKRAADG